MGKQFETNIKRFDGGMKNDVRDGSPNGARLVKNFDTFKYPTTLLPRRTAENGNDTPTRDIKTFTESGGKFWGLGVDTSSGVTTVYYKTNGSDATWTEPANNNSSGLVPKYNPFIPYTYGGDTYLVGFHGSGATGKFWTFKIDETLWTESEQVLNTTTIGQGAYHPTDISLYFPYIDSSGIPQIARDTNGNWDTTALTLGDDYGLPIITAFGEYLAIAVPPSSSITTSRLLLWDRDSSVTAVTASVNLGAGDVYTCAEVNGQIVMVIADGSRLKVKVLEGLTVARTVIDIQFDTAVGSVVPVAQQQQVKNDRLYFLMKAKVEGTNHYGVWSVGQNKAGEWSLSLEHTPEGDTDPNTLLGFYIQENSAVIETIFTAYNDGSNNDVTFTSNSASFTGTSVWESLKFDGGDASQTKKLTSVTVTTAPLPADGVVVLKYKIDEETSFTQIFSDGTDDSLRHTSVNIESSGIPLPQYKEIQFRIESTGNAEITGLKFKYEEIDDDKI